jgi:hypothetical protein
LARESGGLRTPDAFGKSVGADLGGGIRADQVDRAYDRSRSLSTQRELDLSCGELTLKLSGMQAVLRPTAFLSEPSAADAVQNEFS